MKGTAQRTHKIREIVGVYWLAGIPVEELLAKLSSHAMRTAVKRHYNHLTELQNAGVGHPKE